MAQAIRAGKWREHPAAAAWVGKAVATALGLDLENRANKAKVTGLIKMWLSAGSLRVVDGEDESATHASSSRCPMTHDLPHLDNSSFLATPNPHTPIGGGVWQLACLTCPTVATVQVWQVWRCHPKFNIRANLLKAYQAKSKCPDELTASRLGACQMIRRCPKSYVMRAGGSKPQVASGRP